jgi:hypothetical protein
MSLLQLNTLPVQVYGFAGFLLLLFAAFLLFFLLRGLLLWATLARLVKGLERIESTGGDASPLFARDKALRHLWLEFQKTLHEQKEFNPDTAEFVVVALRPTVPAETFFNTQAVVDIRLRTEFFKHLPGIFTGIGIIGTFTGLIMGLQAFKVSESPTVVRDSLDGLLHGVWEAFLVSALAITLAMLVTLIEKLLLASLYQKVESLTQALDSRLRAGAGEEYLSRLVKASEESATQSKILKDSLVSDLKQVLSELTERQIVALNTGNAALGREIGEHIRTSLAGPMENIAQATHGLREDQGDTVTRLLTDVMQGFSQQLQDLFGGQITGINQLQQQTIQALQAAVVRLEQMASEVQAGGAKTADAMAERMAQTMTAMEARQEALNRRMGEFLDHVRQTTRDSQTETQQKLHAALDELGSKVGAMVTALQTQASQAAAVYAEREERSAQRAEQSATQLGDQVDNVLAAVAKANTEMAAAVAALRAVTTDAVGKMNSGADTLYVAASDFAKAGQGVAGVLNQATTVAGTLSQAAGSVTAATRSLDATVAGNKSSQDAIARMVSELQTTVGLAKKEAALTTGILQSIDNAAAKLGVAQADASVYLAKVSEVLTSTHQSFTRNMQASLTAANADFYKELSRATKLLSDGIKELELALGEATDRA